MTTTLAVIQRSRLANSSFNICTAFRRLASVPGMGSCSNHKTTRIVQFFRCMASDKRFPEMRIGGRSVRADHPGDGVPDFLPYLGGQFAIRQPAFVLDSVSAKVLDFEPVQDSVVGVVKTDEVHGLGIGQVGNLLPIIAVGVILDDGPLLVVETEPLMSFVENWHYFLDSAAWTGP